MFRLLATLISVSASFCLYHVYTCYLDNCDKRHFVIQDKYSYVDLYSQDQETSNSEQLGKITWYTMETPYRGNKGVKMYVMSHAYQDIRFKPQIRVVLFALANGNIGSSGRKGTATNYKDIYCHFYTPEGAVKTIPAKAVHGISYNGRRISDIKYYQYIIICETNYNDVKQIALSFDSYYNNKSRMEIIKPSEEHKGTLGICVPSIYGNFTSNPREVVAFIEFMEVYRMFGVSEIVLYVLGIVYSPEFFAVLDYYESMGLLVIINQTIPEYETTPGELGKSAILTSKGIAKDCLYRNMLRFDFIFEADLDDILVPRQHDSYSEMLKFLSVDNKFNYCIGLRPQDFFLDLPQDYHLSSSSQNSILISSKYTKFRRNISYPIKSIYQPKKCFSTDNHGCKSLIKGKADTNDDVLVSYCNFTSPEYVTLHHYRRMCNSGYKLDKDGEPTLETGRLNKCSEGGIFEDGFMKKYEQTLTIKVNLVMNSLNLTFLSSY